MNFTHPAVLYGLFALLIPIIVHLFQLRKFSRVPFSNVDFLKPLKTQTRRSRVLKRWLSLLARLLLIACVVIAFAKPYLPTGTRTASPEQQVIYLDNSLSMQATGENGRLYDYAVNRILERVPSDKEVNLIVNNRGFKGYSGTRLRNQLLSTGYSYNQLDLTGIKLKAQNMLPERTPEITVISDFQDAGRWQADSLDRVFKALQLEPETTRNISLDTAFVRSRDSENLTLAVQLSASQNLSSPVTVSLFNQQMLAAKTSADLSDGSDEIVFTVPARETLNGRLEIADKGLTFDNRLYISTGEQEPVKVLAINQSDGSFLQRIFRAGEFDYTAQDYNQVNYNLISDQNLIVLNGLKDIPGNLASTLNRFTSSGGHVIVIPPEGDLNGYSAISGAGNSWGQQTIEKRIASINYDHPLLEGVFSKRVSNFQYPVTDKVMQRKTAINPVLSYDDGQSFFYQSGNTFVFTSPLDDTVTNFKSSPLIVPLFINVAKQSLPVPQLYYHIGSGSEFALRTELTEDEVLEITGNNGVDYIPRQQVFSNYVMINEAGGIDQPGNYQVVSGEEEVATVSFNYQRTENQLTYADLSEVPGAERVNSLRDVFTYLDSDSQYFYLWKYFILGALFFLICEILILKFL